jgi:hypothetical protein
MGAMLYPSLPSHAKRLPPKAAPPFHGRRDCRAPHLPA